MIKVRLMSLAILVLLLASCGNEPYPSLPAVRIPPGMRAVTIRVHENISVAPGDHVDVLVVGEGKESSTVLQNVEVVEEDQKVGVVEFFVSPDDAQRVTRAGERGQFRLRLWKSD